MVLPLCRTGLVMILVPLAAICSCAWPAGAGDDKALPMSADFTCRFTDEAIVIDGLGDEAAWKKAPTIDGFSLPWLGAKARLARTKTSAKLLWDRENLYFFADMEDGDLFADIKEHDGRLWENDVFEFFLKPSDKHAGYYEFQVNAAGAMLDMFIPRREAGAFERHVKDGKFHMEAKVHLRGTLNDRKDRDRGWSVEGKIPWKDFLRTGGRPDIGEAWKFALCRYDYDVRFDEPELSTAAPLRTPPANFHRHEEYATIRFAGPGKNPALPDHLNQRVEMTTSTVLGFPDPPPPYRARKVFGDLTINFPIAVGRQPDSGLLLLIHAERSYGATRISRLQDDAGARTLTPILDLSDTAYDLTFHPRFKENGYFYVGSNGTARPGEKKKTRVTRYTMERRAPHAVDPKSALVIIEWDSDGHNGGAVTFGHDGMLYVTSGDGTSDSDTTIVGQDMSTLLAKVLRIDVDRVDRGLAYSIPRDNPFVGMKGARPETWALGLRNPWRITTDAVTGHIWVAQNGQDLYEQAYLVRKGDNYGWSVMEGNHPFYLERKKGPNFYTRPTVEHHHSEARSLTGGIVYHGKKHADLQGAYIYGDYSTGRVWAVKHDGDKVVWHREIAQTRLAITGFGVDSRGDILICDHQGNKKGGLYTLEPTPDPGPSTFPRKLSDSGLFDSVKGHVMKPSMIPYSVNAVLWSDGAQKVRWLGLPRGAKIALGTRRGWELPDQTVIVKSFYIEEEEGNPGSRRWIETRFLTRQEGEWYGYSYAWNDEQTEGTLVESRGADRKLNIKVKPSREHPEGKKVLHWHYPSRAECMVCHSRAANWVLGLTDLQFNHVHRHGADAASAENQLVTLERLGLLKVNYYEQARQLALEEAKARGLAEAEAKKFVDELCKPGDQRRPVGLTSFLARSPDKYRRLVDPADATADLTLRVRSYLHANCANCHIEAGGGNAMMDLDFSTPIEKMKIVDVPPVHQTFGIKDARLVFPGHPEKSVLLHRIAHRNAGHMPPLATREVDHAAVRILEEWIRTLK